MKLRNEIVVAAPVGQTWRALLDLPRVAAALPGATIAPDADGGSHRGTMKVKLGPILAEYEGTARIDEVDEDGRTVSFHVQGSSGQGTAAATIANRVEEAPGGGTRVVVETDLRITGRAATFGRGLIEEVSARLLDEFATRLAAELASPRTPAPRTGGPPPVAEPLELGNAVWEPLVRRYGVPLLLVLVLLLLLRRPKVIVVREP